MSVVLFAVWRNGSTLRTRSVLMLAGLGLALIPGVPHVPMDPDLIFLVVLPPLLYGAAWQTPWREFQFNISSILLLAFGLVGFTVFGVAYLGPKLLPGFNWNAAFVLGAVVSTTDAIAATSIGRKLGLPQQIMDVLEGESLVNDASGLLALEFGLAMLVHNESPSVGFALWRLAYLIGVGIGIGLAIGWVIDKLERFIDDGPVEIGITLLVPYGLYLAAEAVHASGVLAVVTAGLFLSRRSATFFSPQVRIQVMAVWSTLIFLLNGFVFLRWACDGTAVPVCAAGVDRYGFPEGADFRGLVQPDAGGASDRLDVPWRVSRDGDPQAHAASTVRLAQSEPDLCGGLDGDARRGGAGGGFATAGAGE